MFNKLSVLLEITSTVSKELVLYVEGHKPTLSEEQVQAEDPKLLAIMEQLLTAKDEIIAA